MDTLTQYFTHKPVNNEPKQFVSGRERIINNIEKQLQIEKQREDRKLVKSVRYCGEVK